LRLERCARLRRRRHPIRLVRLSLCRMRPAQKGASKMGSASNTRHLVCKVALERRKGGKGKGC